MEEAKVCDVWPQVHKILWLPPRPHSGGNQSPCHKDVQPTYGDVHVGPLPKAMWCAILEMEPWAPSRLRTTTPLIDILGAASWKTLSQNQALRLYVSLLAPLASNLIFLGCLWSQGLGAGSLWQMEEATLGRPSWSHEQYARPALSLADGHSIWMRIL